MVLDTYNNRHNHSHYRTIYPSNLGFRQTMSIYPQIGGPMHRRSFWRGLDPLEADLDPNLDPNLDPEPNLDPQLCFRSSFAWKNCNPRIFP